jgi:hypothetical protein
MLLVRKTRDIRETHDRVPPMVSHLLHDGALGKAAGRAPVSGLARRGQPDGGFTGALLRDDGT